MVNPQLVATGFKRLPWVEVGGPVYKTTVAIQWRNAPFIGRYFAVFRPIQTVYMALETGSGIAA
jgi:hypothetical protein